ncbi:MAG TPA: hypothetical protein VD947_04265 [Patescibacteria group bacterium]|nr:hypothetical protein [Patescibacteria group bacterium]
MDFSKEGHIILEDNPVDQDLLAGAVALGEALHDFQNPSWGAAVRKMNDTEVDRAARTLTKAEALAAIKGLAEIAVVEMKGGLSHEVETLKSGDNSARAVKYSHNAVPYLVEIARRGIAESYK